MTKFKLIESKQALDDLCVKLFEKRSLAIDIECENNLHHYGSYVTLIQISDGKHIWIIDVLKIRDVTPLLKIFSNKNIQKVFHDVNFDLRIIYNQWGCNLSNLFDTQLAANFLDKEKVGLGFLLEEYFNLKTEKKFQRVDWTKRPLSKDKLAYAAGDVSHLLQLKMVLGKDLAKQQKLSWLIEECDNLQTMDWSYKEQTYLDVSGVKSMNDYERSIFHALFDVRKLLAEQVDKPVFMIFSNKQMLAFAKNPPRDWILVKRVHPIVAEQEDLLKKLVDKASKIPEPLEKVTKQRLNSKQYKWTKDLLVLRNKIAKRNGLKGHLIMNNDQIWDLAANKNLDGLRNWQKDLIANEKLVLEIIMG
jgi:ribonuclease D